MLSGFKLLDRNHYVYLQWLLPVRLRKQAILLFVYHLADSGIVLTGGGALLTNLDKLLNKESGLPITITEDPLSTVALGAGKAIDNIEILKQVMI